MASDPGDLVLDPTCGSGTTATVAEQWGRRWITIDTSRVALALARARIMGARYPYYLLADSRDGQIKEAEVARSAPSSQSVHGNIRHGFVYERVPHITLKSIANNAEIDVIWDKSEQTLAPLREKLNTEIKKQWQEWEIPRVAEDPWETNTQEIFYALKAEQGRRENASSAKLAELLQTINRNLKRNYTLKSLPERPADPWSEIPASLHADWWQARIARQKEIDASIAAKAEFEYLYDKPYADNKKVRVAGPFTVESLSPHRVLGVDENDELIDSLKEPSDEYGPKQSFPQMILENLKTAGVQQAHKEDKITFAALTAWPGEMVCGEGRYLEGDAEKRAAIFIGPEFGTVQRADLVAATREAGDAGFDVLIACAFNYDAHYGVHQAGSYPGAQGPHERRPAHGGGFEEHGKGQPLRHLRRAGHRVDAGERWQASRQGKRRGRFQTSDRRSHQRRGRRHRLLVHRHRLQRRKFLCPPRLLSRRQRSLQRAKDHA